MDPDKTVNSTKEDQKSGAPAPVGATEEQKKDAAVENELAVKEPHPQATPPFDPENPTSTEL